MKLYIYKSPLKTEKFNNKLLVEPFVVPQSARKYLETNDTFYIYVFKERPSKYDMVNNVLKETIILEDISDTSPKEDLKKEIKDIKTWQTIALFNY